MPDNSAVTGDDIIRRLRAGKLPQMVDWINPSVMAAVGVRLLISTTIGQYADQRPMQESSDGDSGAKLASRHDYSLIDAGQQHIVAPDADSTNPNWNPDDPYHDIRIDRRLVLGKDGAVWADFVADLGDGFEATYAMAFLMAASELEVAGTKRKEKHNLPAGQFLIFGGDLAYPNATMEEYRNRCLNPYDWAFTADRPAGGHTHSEPRRELFFIAGNHDWYDGLAAFTNQFCYETSAVGGWRIRQERSYFALKLPHNWWIWGIDIALGDSIDVGQRHYFRDVVKKIKDDREAGKDTEPAKIVIMLHAPDWLKEQYRGLTAICDLARQEGELCAVLAGDLHFYARWQEMKPEPGKSPLQLIVSGGGGAFAHPTYDQKEKIFVEPAVAGDGTRGGGYGPGSRPSPLLSMRRSGTKRANFAAGPFYPSKATSRLHELRNLWLPFHNRRFALLVGLVYLLFGWVFQIAVADPTIAIKSAQHVKVEMECRATKAGNEAQIKTCIHDKAKVLSDKLDAITSTEEAPSVSPADNFEGWWNGVRAKGIGRTLWNILSVQFSPDRLLSGLLASPAFLFLVLGLWAALINYVDVVRQPRFLQWPMKIILGTLHAWAHLTVLLATSTVFGLIYTFFGAPENSLLDKLLALSVYSALMIFIGGALGSIVYGCYWVITSLLFSMHPESFGALGIKDYKNFVRMKFEKDTLTLYPVALDTVPGRFGWRARRSGEYEDHKPLIVPVKKLKPRLIEEPIVIRRTPPNQTARATASASPGPASAQPAIAS